MSHFYGEVQGARGEAHRTGHKSSGIRTTAKSFTTSVEVRYWWDDKKEQNMITITVKNLHTSQRLELYDGPEDSILVVNKLQEADDNRR